LSKSKASLVNKMFKSFKTYLNEKQDATANRLNLIKKIKRSGVASGSMSNDKTKKPYVSPLDAYYKAMKKHEERVSK